MTKVAIGELKARLSSYLRRVGKGETLIVMNRDIPVARILSVEVASVATRVISARSSLGEGLKISRVKPRHKVDSLAILRSTRGER